MTSSPLLRKLCLFAITLSTLSSLTSSAHAYSLLSEEERQLDLGIFARTRFGATSTDGGSLEPGADVIQAWIRGKASFKDLGHAVLNVETRNQPGVFDAFINIDLGSPVGVAVGLMRVPLSREMLINIPLIPTYDRTWLSGTFAPRRRVGALLHGNFKLSSLTIKPRLGAYNPGGGTRAAEEGLLLVGGVDIAHTSRISMHIAAMTHVLEPDLSAIPEELRPVYPPGEQLDLALFYDGEHLRLLAEGLLVKPEGSREELPFGVHAFAAYKFTPEGHRFAYEPAITGDYVKINDDLTIERVTANFNWLLVGRNLQLTFAYGWESREVTTHRLLSEFQVLF